MKFPEQFISDPKCCKFLAGAEDVNEGFFDTEGIRKNLDAHGGMLPVGAWNWLECLWFPLIVPGGEEAMAQVKVASSGVEVEKIVPEGGPVSRAVTYLMRLMDAKASYIAARYVASFDESEPLAAMPMALTEWVQADFEQFLPTMLALSKQVVGEIPAIGKYGVQ